MGNAQQHASRNCLWAVIGVEGGIKPYEQKGEREEKKEGVTGSLEPEGKTVFHFNSGHRTRKKRGVQSPALKDNRPKFGWNVVTDELQDLVRGLHLKSGLGHFFRLFEGHHADDLLDLRDNR